MIGIKCSCDEIFYLNIRWNGIVHAKEYYTHQDYQLVKINHCPGCGEYLSTELLQDPDVTCFLTLGEILDAKERRDKNE